MTVEQMRDLEGRLVRAAVWLHDQYSEMCTNPDDCRCGTDVTAKWLIAASDLLAFVGDE